MFKTPILFLIYNRPDLTEKVFSKIRKIKPKKLFISADGPKNETEKENCEKTRDIINKVDWPCQLETLFQEENLGCKLAVSSAISWFFDHVENGIILEDDTVPNMSFFHFCEELLDMYQDDKKVMSITGVSWTKPSFVEPFSYYFSTYPGIWGWATWKDRWNKFDLEMKGFKEFIGSNILDEICFSSKEKKVIENYLNEVYHNKIDTWDYIWHYTNYLNKGLCIRPNKNLVSNIGFDHRSTHTKDKTSIRFNQKSHSINKTLKHPKKILRNKEADYYLINTTFFPKRSVFYSIKSVLKRYVRLKAR